MIRAGVRALLVLEEGRLLGLITSYDILGERPIQFLQSPACSHDTCLHRDVLVADIMTPLEQLPTLDLRSLRSASVGDLVESLKATEQTHLVVMESRPDGSSLAWSDLTEPAGATTGDRSRRGVATSRGAKRR